MASGRAILVVILAGVMAGCGVSTAPSPVRQATSSPTLPLLPGGESTDPTGSPSPPPSARPSAEPTSVPKPPKPTDVSFNQRRRPSKDASMDKITQTVKWGAPRSKGVEIRVFGVTKCIAKPAAPSPGTIGPCLLEHSRLPASVRTLLAKAPASDGVVSWSWTGAFDCGPYLAYPLDGPGYDAVVLAAYNRSGHSTFAIAEPGEWYEPGPDEIVC